MRALGRKQAWVLLALRKHGSWHRQAGWVWDSPSGTQRVLDTLLDRGLVCAEQDVATGRVTYFPVKQD